MNRNQSPPAMYNETGMNGFYWFGIVCLLIWLSGAVYLTRGYFSERKEEKRGIEVRRNALLPKPTDNRDCTRGKKKVTFSFGGGSSESLVLEAITLKEDS